jgi:acyl dehydratase
MPLHGYSYQTIQEFVGRELGVSDWLTIDQDRINNFAGCTDDHQWIHVDLERAKQESRYGTTIAHGFLTLSLLPRFHFDTGIIPRDISQAINYGLDKVRFIAPVKTGKRVRNRVVLLSVEDKAGGRLVKTQNTVEIEGEDKPAMVAELLYMMFGVSPAVSTTQ